VFLRHCEDVGRDPSEVLIIVGLFLVLVENEKEGRATIERIPEERRPMVAALTVPQAAELIAGFVDAGFGGIRMSNQMVTSNEAMDRAAELISVVNGTRVGA
jgi:alkanesulfonate monooxygenase SsuD/methylene tetrahydromethanopterin reductase-like flavin-dependent oxidoreductase (luciferase family)